jgi:uncharacterized protein (TIGR02271 family)
MTVGTDSTTPTSDDSSDLEIGEAPSRVVPLGELDDYEVADGFPEVRGWDVRDSAGRSIGYVYDLLVDLGAMRVAYLDVELDPEFAGSDAERRVLVPLESVNLDGGADEVLLSQTEASDVHTLVPYARRGVTRERETELRPRPAADDVARSPLAAADSELDRARHFDDERLFTRDDVEVERRALRPGEDADALAEGEEIRIPILAEEIVVEKRLVAKEVLIIRKRVVTEERIVEADVRRERLEIDDPAGRVRRAGPRP